MLSSVSLSRSIMPKVHQTRNDVHVHTEIRIYKFVRHSRWLTVTPASDPEIECSLSFITSLLSLMGPVTSGRRIA